MQRFHNFLQTCFPGSIPPDPHKCSSGLHALTKALRVLKLLPFMPWNIFKLLCSEMTKHRSSHPKMSSFLSTNSLSDEQFLGVIATSVFRDDSVAKLVQLQLFEM